MIVESDEVLPVGSQRAARTALDEWLLDLELALLGPTPDGRDRSNRRQSGRSHAALDPRAARRARVPS